MCLNQILDLYIAVPKTQTEFIRFTYSISISTIFCVLAYLKGYSFKIPNYIILMILTSI